MDTASSVLSTWEEPSQEFVLHYRATAAKKTARYYEVQITQLTKWATQTGVAFAQFGKRHLDRYLVFRQEEGKSRMTLRHDAMCAKVFFQWCAKNDFLARSPLAEYHVNAAPYPVRYMPTDDDVRSLLKATVDYWTPERNPLCRFNGPRKRAFHRERSYCLVLGLLDTACRIGELLSLKLDDYRSKERQILIRESKGKTPRALPISAEWARAVDSWMKVRTRVMAGAEQDEGYLFISETGGMIDAGRFLKTLHAMCEYAALTDKITLHSLRRFSINKLAKTNLLAAQQIAGHRSSDTTLLYTKLDAEFVRGVHDDVGVVRGIIGERRVKKPSRRLV